eukprot:s3095_g6.t1
MTAASEDDSNEARLKALETNVSEILARLRDLSPPAPAAMPEKPAGLKAKAKNRRSKEQCPDASCPRRGGVEEADHEPATSIVKQLASQKKKAAKEKTLDNLLDGWDAGMLRVPLNQARALARCLDPKLQPGGWLERRSRLGFYPATIRLVWAIAGVWDCLRENKVSEATARAALSIASIDQNALDAGSWVLAQELFLEQPAPLSAFQAKRNIGHDASENFHTSSTPAGQVSCCIASKKSKAIWMLSKQKLPGAGEGAGADDESRNPRGGKDLEKGAGKGADKPSGPSGSGAK